MGKGRWLAVLAGVLLLGGVGPRAREMEELRLVTDIVMWAALILTVVSLADYLMKNREVMRETK